MSIPPLQAHVLANLSRVVPLVGAHGSAHRRYQLDGKECTYQIIGLTVRKLISERPSGTLENLVLQKARAHQQRPSAKTIDKIRATMARPAVVRKIRSARLRSFT